ncbi:YegP family protein [Arthrobacter sp. MMS18-M83]|uniref:YegP family protein n=1 Tax=Arthrobacter sp. MMS18-M83 TaxID=2996261 RepID=UPI002DD43776|nr:YegP family protein [Arthrobacter sp. MMS18-M83]
MFEVFVDGDSLFRFRLKSPDGMVIAVSTPFEDKSGAVAGIAAARECAGMGLVTDLCPAAGARGPAKIALPSTLPQSTVPQSTLPQSPAPQACDEQRKASDGFRTRTKELRRAATAPRWTGAA